jgi:hypothetical protein
METTAKGWLGLTLQCAQCHNHKYDPITQKEYYGLFAMLNNADEPEYKIPDAKIAAKRAEAEAQIAKLESKLADEFPLEDPATKWAVLKPSKLKAASGATLSASEDGTVIASGTLGASEKYTFQLEGTSPARHPSDSKHWPTHRCRNPAPVVRPTATSSFPS